MPKSNIVRMPPRQARRITARDDFSAEALLDGLDYDALYGVGDRTPVIDVYVNARGRQAA